ncbi:hypothetical protein F5883DRAFT_42408 [Diaporthe sp. PMI_573]|nr:hypothetical protein F5883DRAFT_42408 [Diaporthaceae sp. PMI_573]
MSWATDAGSNASNDWKWIVDCAPCGLTRMTTENHVWVFVLIHSQESRMVREKVVCYIISVRTTIEVARQFSPTVLCHRHPCCLLAIPRIMSSIMDFSETASAIGSASQCSHLDDSELTVATGALTPSSSSTPSMSRPRTSPVWEYCRIEAGKSTPVAWVDSNGTKWWHCQPCFDKKREKKYNYSGGSSTIVNHLRTGRLL